jgi:hypothetical protein
MNTKTAGQRSVLLALAFGVKTYAGALPSRVAIVVVERGMLFSVLQDTTLHTMHTNAMQS